MIRVALSTGSIYTYGTARAFELAAGAGYDGVELIVDDRWDTRQAAYVRRLSEQYEIPVLSVHRARGGGASWNRPPGTRQGAWWLAPSGPIWPSGRLATWRSGWRPSGPGRDW